MKGLTLTTREQARIQVLNGVIERKVLMAEAAELMRVSERHAWRLLAAYRKEGAAGVAHGNRGRRPSTATSPETQEQVTGASQGPLRRLQPLASDRAVGRAGGRRSVPLHRPAGAAGGRCSESPPPPSAQALSAQGALPPGGDAAADRREQARLVGGSGTPPDAHRGRGRRHGDGPLRPIQRTGGRPRLLAHAQGDHRPPRRADGPL